MKTNAGLLNGNGKVYKQTARSISSSYLSKKMQQQKKSMNLEKANKYLSPYYQKEDLKRIITKKIGIDQKQKGLKQMISRKKIKMDFGHGNTHNQKEKREKKIIKQLRHAKSNKEMQRGAGLQQIKVCCNQIIKIGQQNPEEQIKLVKNQQYNQHHFKQSILDLEIRVQCLEVQNLRLGQQNSNLSKQIEIERKIRSNLNDQLQRLKRQLQKAIKQRLIQTIQKQTAIKQKLEVTELLKRQQTLLQAANNQNSRLNNELKKLMLIQTIKYDEINIRQEEENLKYRYQQILKSDDKYQNLILLAQELSQKKGRSSKFDQFANTKIEAYYSEVISHFEKITNKNAECLSTLAYCYSSILNYILAYRDKGPQANDYINKVIAIYDSDLPNYYEEKIILLNNIAIYYQKKGSIQELQQNYKQIMKLQDRYFSVSDQRKYLTKNNLACALCEYGQYKKGQTLFVQCLNNVQKGNELYHSILLNYNHYRQQTNKLQ